MTRIDDFTRKQIEAYMIDCHGFDVEQLTEWDTKTDMCCDIRANGWEREAIDYLS